MATSLTGKLKTNIAVTEVRTGDLANASSPMSIDAFWTIASGVGLGQANTQWSDERTLTTAATEDLDLSGGLTGLFGAVVFAKLKGYIFVANPANTTNITISRPAANGVAIFGAASDALAPLKPGGFVAFGDPSLAGITVTAGTADLITVTNSAGASATYKVGLIGTDA
jgi:hypothetical protein